MAERGDIVQITDPEHPWYPCLLIVGEVKSWGVQACVLSPGSNDGSKPPGEFWNRLATVRFEVVGKARIVPGEEER